MTTETPDVQQLRSTADWIDKVLPKGSLHRDAVLAAADWIELQAAVPPSPAVREAQA